MARAVCSMRKEALLLLSVCSAFLLLTFMLGASKRVRAACCQLVINMYAHAVQVPNRVTF